MTNISLSDHTALASLADGPSLTTMIAHATGLSSASIARTMLRRLERHGLVKSMSRGPGYICSWQITDAGRAAIGADETR